MTSYYFNEQGLILHTRNGRSDLMRNPLLYQAKAGNTDAALKLIQSRWSDSLKHKLFKVLSPYVGGGAIVFLSVPSTSGKNQIPIVLAQFLSQQMYTLFERKKIKSAVFYRDGTHYFKTLHGTMMKTVPSDLSLFFPRLYGIKSHIFIGQEKEFIQNATIILVDDFLTTGSSLWSFKRFLERLQIMPRLIIGLDGKLNLNPTEEDIFLFEDVCHQAGLSETISKLRFELTRLELKKMTSLIQCNLLKTTQSKALLKKQSVLKERLTALADVRVQSDDKSIVKLYELLKNDTKGMHSFLKSQQKMADLFATHQVAMPHL